MISALFPIMGVGRGWKNLLVVIAEMMFKRGEEDEI
jgi:hypothetical protein